jgi:hypothetical protein
VGAALSSYPIWVKQQQLESIWLVVGNSCLDEWQHWVHLARLEGVLTLWHSMVAVKYMLPRPIHTV